jgi:signal transduction histidine kinase
MPLLIHWRNCEGLDFPVLAGQMAQARVIYRFSHINLIRLAGLVIWVSVSVPLIFVLFRSDTTVDLKTLIWLCCHLAFGVIFWILTRQLGSYQLSGRSWLLLIALLLMVFAINWATGSAMGVLYALIVSVLLPWILANRLSLLILLMQNTVIGWQLFTHSIGSEASLLDKTLFIFLFVGFSLFSYIISLVARRQQNAKEELRKLNSELRATQVLLSDSSRINERLRISRELHDLLGHHLTALSMNLEVASHLADDRVKEHVDRSQTLARLLLSDVREVVSAFRNRGTLDLGKAIEELIDDIPSHRIDLDVPEQLLVEDPALAQTVLRCAQELITNCLKHAHASAFRIRLQKLPQCLRLEFEDNGRGLGDATEGNGMTGIRERMKQIDGEFAIIDPQRPGFRARLTFPTGA